MADLAVWYKVSTSKLAVKSVKDLKLGDTVMAWYQYGRPRWWYSVNLVEGKGWKVIRQSNDYLKTMILEHVDSGERVGLYGHTSEGGGNLVQILPVEPEFNEHGEVCY